MAGGQQRCPDLYLLHPEDIHLLAPPMSSMIASMPTSAAAQAPLKYLHNAAATQKAAAEAAAAAAFASAGGAATAAVAVAQEFKAAGAQAAAAMAGRTAQAAAAAAQDFRAAGAAMAGRTAQAANAAAAAAETAANAAVAVAGGAANAAAAYAGGAANAAAAVAGGAANAAAAAVAAVTEEGAASLQACSLQFTSTLQALAEPTEDRHRPDHEGMRKGSRKPGVKKSKLLSGGIIPMGVRDGQVLVGDGSITLIGLLTDISFQVYVGVHIGALVAAVSYCSWRLVGLCMALYVVRMFGITGGYHRLLSHRSYKTSRGGQFVMAWLGALAFQKGPLWWCSHHRHHHRTADTAADVHSPMHYGFWWSHFGWFLFTKKNEEPSEASIPDLTRYPELRWLDKYHYIPPLSLGAVLYGLGGLPALGWGFFISTVLCWHATYCINSIAHLLGSRRFRCEFNTHCDARNNWFLALATLGEGWHNNHHCYMRSARHGFYLHEIDMTYYILYAFSRLGLVWDLELPPLKQLEKDRYDTKSFKCRCDQVEKDLVDVTKAHAS